MDAITGDKKIVNIATLIPDSLSAGGYKRSESSPFAYYGLEIGQVAVSKIDYSETVKKQIAQQQKANMDIQTAKAQAAAQQDAIKAEELGKAAAMTAKWEQEKVKAVEVTKAQQAYEVAALAAKEAMENAKKVKAEGDAEAFRQAALVRAGLSPKEKATIEMQTKIGVAEALSKLELPKIVMAGGNTSNGNAAMDAMGLKMVSDLVDKMSN